MGIIEIKYMACDIVKKHKNILKDTFRHITYVIYSDRKLDKKEMMREVRYYFVKNDFSVDDCSSRVMIIARD